MSLLKSWVIGHQIKQGLKQSGGGGSSKAEPESAHSGKNFLYKTVAFSLLAFLGYRVYAKNKANESIGFSQADELANRFNSAFSMWGDDEDSLFMIAYEIPDEVTWKAVQDSYQRAYGEPLKQKLADKLDAVEMNLFYRYLKDKSQIPKQVAKSKGYDSVQAYQDAHKANAIKTLSQWSRERKAFILPTATKQAPEQMAYPRYLMDLTGWADATLKYKQTIRPISYRHFGKIISFRKNSKGVYDLIKIQITNKNMKEYGQAFWFVPSAFTATPPPEGFNGSLSGLLI